MGLVNLGQSAGAEVALPSATVRGKRLRIIGHTVFSVPLEELAAAATRDARARPRRLAGAGRGDYPAGRRAAAAWERQKAGPHTKLVDHADA